MRVIKMTLPGVLCIEPVVFNDNRGHFLELYHAERYIANHIGAPFVQDNLSFSTRGVLRGLHYQLGAPQSKLVMAVSGTIFDVAVDVRAGSATFGRWTGATLSCDNRRQMFIPQGFAHGFCVLSDTATVLYKCTDYYSPQEERGLRWDDPDLAIEWPVIDPILSGKDAALPLLGVIDSKDLPTWREV